MIGQIVEIVSNLYTVSYDNKHYKCRARGVFRNQGITPVVGDFCKFSITKLLIEEILPRKNIFSRPKVSNIDIGIIVTSLKLPDFSINLLDRFITIMEINNVLPVICVTKKDLLSDSEFASIKKVLDYYQDIGYTVVFNDQVDEIKKIIKGKTVVFTGQTGAGKSTLINKLSEELALKIGEVSQALGRGRHTTRVVSLYEVDGAKVVDTPGFSSIDFSNYTLEEIKNSFVEFSLHPCIYRDCTHTGEEECNIKKCVLDNIILEERYQDYLKFIKER